MITIQCYDCLFTVEGGEALGDLLQKLGFELSTVAEERPLQAFRLEKKGRHFDLFLRSFPIVREQTEALIAQILATRIHTAVCQEREEFTFLRGDTVRRRGQALLIAGDEMTGQTRLARAFEADEPSLWSENFAVLNEAGQFLPYPARNIPAEGPVVGQVLLLDYRPDSEPNISVVSPGVASLHLLTLVRGKEGAVPRAMPRLTSVCKTAEYCWKGLRGEAEETVRQLAVRVRQA